METRRWLSVAAALLAAGGTGINYAYSVYSGALKNHFHLEQSDVDTIGIVGNVTCLVTFALGSATDRWGPAITTFIGGVVFAASYFCQWMVIRYFPDLSEATAVQALCQIQIIGGLGNGLVTGAVFATCVRNFPSPAQRGSIVGLVKAAVGLSGAILTQGYTGFVQKPNDNPDTLDFLLVLGVWVVLFTVFPSYLLRGFPTEHNELAQLQRHKLFSQLSPHLPGSHPPTCISTGC